MPSPRTLACFLVLASLPRASGIDGGAAGQASGTILGKDANGAWWQVTIVDEHADGTVACVVHDDESTLWPSVHRANLMLDDERAPPSQQVAVRAPPSQQGSSGETKESVVLAAVSSIKEALTSACVFCWRFFEVEGPLDAGSTKGDGGVVPPASRGAAALCKSNPGCSLLGGEGGLCCPTADGTVLECCHGVSELNPPPAVSTPAAGGAGDWAPVGLERSDLIGSWDFASGYFSIAVVGGNLRLEISEARLPGGRGTGDFFANRALGSGALPTARVQSGSEQRVAMRIQGVEGNRIFAEIKRDDGPDWVALVAMRRNTAAPVAPAVVAEQDWAPVGAENTVLLGRWGYGEGAFWIADVQGQLHFEEQDARLPGGVARGPLFIKARRGENDMPIARLASGDGVARGAVRLELRQAPGQRDQLGVTYKLERESDWRTREILAMRAPA